MDIIARKRNVPYGQSCRIRKNCTEDNIQSKVIAKRFLNKGYPKILVEKAYQKAKALNQEKCLEMKINPSSAKSPVNCTNFITKYNRSHRAIHNVLRKYWYILQKDPYLRPLLSQNPHVTYRRPPTLKSILAPSRLHQHRST